MARIANKRRTIGVLAGSQVYYGTILGNFIGPLLHGFRGGKSSVQPAVGLRHEQFLLYFGASSMACSFP